MEGMEKFKEKNIKVVYRDIDKGGKETTGIKIGRLIDFDSDFLYIESSKTLIAIPKSIIRRVERV